MATPNPGSQEAVRAGCDCPVTANAGGRDQMMVGGHLIRRPEGNWVIRETCPLHGSKATVAAKDEAGVLVRVPDRNGPFRRAWRAVFGRGEREG